MSVIEQASLDDRLTALLESRPDAIADPYPVYHELLERSPVHQLGPSVVLTRYDDVKLAIREPRRMSSQAYRVGSRAKQLRARLSADEVTAFDEVAAFEMMYISRADGEVHQELRDIAMRPFGPRRIVELRATIVKYLNELLSEALRDGPETVDLVPSVMMRLPVMVICTLLNVPLSDAPMIKAWSGRIGKNRGGAVVADLMDAHAAMTDFRAYVQEILDDSRRHPDSTDLVAAFMGAEDEARLSAEQLTAQFVVLLFAGSDTTNALLANGLLALIHRPDEWRALCEDPSLVKPAVEELLRWVSPVQFLWRVTTAPMVFGGVEIPADTTVMPVLAAANRDPRVFTDPDAVDLRRVGASAHITFGYGPHFCLGNALARMESEIFFSTIARRFPDLEPAADPSELVWHGNAMFRTVKQLPVTLGRDRGGA
jgi:cytochrome P450